MKNSIPNWHKDPCTAKLILRLTLGIAFIVHGWMKVKDLTGITSFFENSLNMPADFGIVIAYGELIAGILVLIGLWTRYASFAIAIIMLGAIFLVKIKSGYFGMELAIAYLAIALTLGIIGPGRHSLSHKLKRSK